MAAMPAKYIGSSLGRSLQDVNLWAGRYCTRYLYSFISFSLAGKDAEPHLRYGEDLTAT